MLRAYSKQISRVEAADILGMICRHLQRVREASAFIPCTRTDLDRIFSIQTERTVIRDNKVRYNNVTLRIDRQSWRRSMDGCRVTVYQHLN